MGFPRVSISLARKYWTKMEVTAAEELYSIEPLITATKMFIYKKRVVVQNISNLLLKIFCETFKHYNYFIKF
jgi:hypothetical protein